MLLDRIRLEIERDGPMHFDRFMSLALYDPEHGYFATGAVRSEKEGDFLTSPEVSPRFGATLARLVDDEWRRIGDPLAVVEVGAGTGSLLRPLLDVLDRPPEVYAVEASPSARQRLAATVPEAKVLDSSDRLPQVLRGVVLANELLDNMAAAVLVRRGDSWAERVVVVEGGALAFAEVRASPAAARWAEAYAGPVPDGGVVEVQADATAWVGDMVRRLERGVLVVVDYGDTAEGLAARRPEGTVRTYRGHHLGPPPLLEPGATDITMDVNFSAAMEAARSAGAEVTLLRQYEFLTDLGLRDVLADLRTRERDAARSGDTITRLRVRDAIVGGEALLHPRGLGDFRVMVARV